MKFFLNIFLLVLIALAGMVSSQCTNRCPGGGQRICARDPQSTSGNGGYQEFPNHCEMQKTNCLTGKRFYFVRNGNCNVRG